MNPVVPGVRPGDVLVGTRILRRWLKATANYIKAFDGVLEDFYTADKNTQFVVAVNAGSVFIVWANQSRPGRKDHLILLPFINVPTPTALQPNSNPLAIAESFQERMSPSLFSRWFVKTNDRSLDLRKWPAKAYACWVLYQMNSDLLGHCDSMFNSACSNQGLWKPLPVFYHVVDPPSRANLENLVKEAASRGLSRAKDQRGGRLMQHVLCGIGPTESGIKIMEARTHEKEQINLKNHIVLEQLKAKVAGKITKVTGLAYTINE